MFPIRNAVPSRHVPLVTWVLIAINSVVFLAELRLDPNQLQWFLQRFALIPAQFFGTGGEWPAAHYAAFLTNIFLHASWLHFIVNIWTLWLFGPPVEDRLGSARFILLYIAGGLIASALHALSHPGSPVPALCASGAVATLIGAYLRMFPSARLVLAVPLFFFPTISTMPAALYAALWFGIQLLQGHAALFMPTVASTGVWWAHVGAFAVGILLAPILRRSPRDHRPYYADEGVLGFGPRGS